MFGFIKNTLKKIYVQLTSKLGLLFTKKQIDEDTLEELEKLLLSADTGIATTRHIITQLKQKWQKGELSDGTLLRGALGDILCATLASPENHSLSPVILLVGINGSGKTTFAGKLARLLKQQGKRVLLVAGDTFRAAATNQLEELARRIGVEILIGAEGQDPASVIFEGCKRYQEGACDTLVIDTAGRLQTKVNLMRELEKIRRIIDRKIANAPITTLLTIDGMLGQNSFEQARLFKESTHVSGVVLTKMDGSGKGGIIFSIVNELRIPIAYLSFGEQFDQFKPFNSNEYVHDLLNN